MSFPRYPAYKPSGVAWLGEVPEHWEVTKTKHVTGFTTGWTPPTGDDSAYEGENLWANISDLGPRFLEDTAKRISDRAVAASRISPSPTGSLLFSFKLSIGQVSLAGRDLYTNEAIATFHGSSRLLIPFAYHAFPIFLVQNATENIYGAKLLNQELIKAATFPLPPRAEQLAIATFLDRETAKIDALIAEQQRLIQLLQEKRQAVISHAVTKGLNPDAPMKDSGVEWLGEVPEHWDVTQLRHYSKSIPGFAFPSAQFVEDESQWKLLRGINVGVSCIRWDEAVYWERRDDDQLDQYVLTPGDLVVGLDRPLIKEGLRVARVGPADCPCLLLQRVAAVKGTTELATDYLFYLLSSPIFIAHFEPDTTGVSVPHISTGQIDSFVVPKPPKDEQQRIVNYLSEELSKIEELMNGSTESIYLLQERRSALISAAVTGQIDVRGLVPEVDAA